MVNSEPISFPIQIGLEVLEELEYFLQQSKALALFMGGNYMIIPLQQCYFHCSHFRVNFENIFVFLGAKILTLVQKRLAIETSSSS